MPSDNTYPLLVLFLTFFGRTVKSYYQNETARDQLITFKMKTKGPVGILTTTAGYPVPMEDTMSINRNLLLDELFLETMTHFSRERIPERVVHAKGAGAYGYFQVTHDLCDITRAKVFCGVGKTTPIISRFSTVFQRRGGTDVGRENRGMAVKFYSEEGNYDQVLLDIEMFVIKDPILFPDFIHAFMKNPKTQVADPNTVWDFLTSHPESLFTFFRLFADRGIPDGYRYVPYFAIHTFEMINTAAERNYVRIHVLPDAGERYLTNDQARIIQGNDLDYATRDLYNAIANHTYPTWTMYVQVIPEADVQIVGFDIFDVTKIWPLKDFPLRPVGRYVFDRNPDDQFAEVELLAYNPGNLVPGIRGVDKVFESRVLSYRDTHYYRLGANFNKIPGNCPLSPLHTYVRDGRAPVLDNGAGGPNYIGNSFNGPIPIISNDPPRITVFTDPRPNNFDQANYLYVHEMSADEKRRFIETITSTLRNTEPFLQDKAVKLYKMINIELGTRIELAL